MSDSNVLDMHMHELKLAGKEFAKASPVELTEIAIEGLNALANKYPGIATRESMDPAFMIAKAAMLKLKKLIETGALIESQKSGET